MGLFDDILKKPQDTAPTDPIGQGSGSTGDDGSTGGNPPVSDQSTSVTPPFLIAKSEEKSLFDAPVKAEEAPILSMDTAPETPVVHADEGSESILMGSVPATSEEVTEVPSAQVVPEIIAEKSETNILSLSEDVPVSPLFGVTNEDVPSITEEKKTTSFLHPKEFIEKSLSDIDAMIADIDTAHAAKIAQAEGYGAEKDRFATLEKDTYSAASTLDEEKAQALHVRELLEKELSTAKQDEEALEALMPTEKAEELSEAIPPVSTEETPSGSSVESVPVGEIPVVGSVETTLTGLAVQNTVTETIETKNEVTPVVGETPKAEEATPVVSLI